MPNSILILFLAAGALACGWGGWEIWTSYVGKLSPTHQGPSRRWIALYAAIPFVGGLIALLASGLERPELILAAAAISFAAAGLFALLAAQNGIEGERELHEAHSEIRALHASLEESRLETLRAEDSAEKAKTQFLSNMSHEMRTPLAGVLGAVELLAGDAATSPSHRRYLHIIDTSTRSLLQLVDNVLDYTLSESESKTPETVRHPFNLDATLEQAHSVMELAAHEKDLELSLNIAGNIPRHLEGDATCVLRILLNLLDNAIKFTEKGSVLVQARLDDPPASLRFDGAALRIWLRFEVIDTGIGIGDSTEVILFEPLVQKDTSMTRAYGGAGMGLAVSRRLAGAIGGRIEVDSRPGLGSTFSLVAPFDVVQTADAAQPLHDAPPLSQPHPEPEMDRARRQLLIVDDDPVSRLIAESQAHALGYEVDVVESGLDAIEALRHHDYSAVLMDCRMPGLDGYETTRRWRGQEQESRLPVIAVTAHAKEGERERCLAAGMDEMLEKPVAVEELAATLDRMLPN